MWFAVLLLKLKLFKHPPAVEQRLVVCWCVAMWSPASCRGAKGHAVDQFLLLLLRSNPIQGNRLPGHAAFLLVWLVTWCTIFFSSVGLFCFVRAAAGPGDVIRLRVWFDRLFFEILQGPRRWKGERVNNNNNKKSLKGSRQLLQSVAAAGRKRVEQLSFLKTWYPFAL